MEGIGYLAQVGTGVLGLLRIRSDRLVSSRGVGESPSRLAFCFRLCRAIFVHVCATVLSFAFSVSLALGYGGSFTFTHTRRRSRSHTLSHSRLSCSCVSCLSVVRGGESTRARPRRSSLSHPFCVSPASLSRAAHSCGGAVSPHPCLFVSLRRCALARHPLSAVAVPPRLCFFTLRWRRAAATTPRWPCVLCRLRRPLLPSSGSL